MTAQGLIPGRTIQMLLLVVTILAIYYYIRAGKAGKKFTLRPLPALDAIDEGVAHAAEMGRPVHFTPGYTLGGLYNPDMGPGVVAGITVLKKIAESTAKRGVKLIVTLAQPEAIPLVEETVNAAYAAENKKPPLDTVRFISTEQYAWAAGVLGVMVEERPGTNFLFGYFWSESLQFAEGTSYIGAKLITGTSSPSQIAFFAVTSEEFLIGEELFAARAYIEQDPAHLGSIAGQDLFRIIMIGICLIGWIAASLVGKEVLSVLNI